MRPTTLVRLALVSAVPLQPGLAQTKMLEEPARDYASPPIPQGYIEVSTEVTRDAARDLKDSRFYNKPGATRAQYDADWQACRLIARGSLIPATSIPYTYTSVAGAAGGALGALIAGAMAEGQQRRANRQTCLLIKGWRMVQVTDAEKARIAALSDAERDRYFSTIVGAQTVPGTTFQRTDFTLINDSALHLDAPLSGTGTVWAGKKIDPAAPLQVAKGEGVIVIGFRRVVPEAAGRIGGVQLARYDMDKRDLVFRPSDWKKKGDATTYGIDAMSADKKATYEVQVRRVTAGDYALNATTIGLPLFSSTNCFGAPVFHVGEGEVVYIGDFVPVMKATLSTGETGYSGLYYTSFPEDARKTLATRQPELADKLQAAALRNGATYTCTGITMTRWDIAGVEKLAAPSAATTAAGN